MRQVLPHRLHQHVIGVVSGPSAGFEAVPRVLVGTTGTLHHPIQRHVVQHDDPSQSASLLPTHLVQERVRVDRIQDPREAGRGDVQRHRHVPWVPFEVVVRTGRVAGLTDVADHGARGHVPQVTEPAQVRVAGEPLRADQPDGPPGEPVIDVRDHQPGERCADGAPDAAADVVAECGW